MAVVLYLGVTSIMKGFTAKQERRLENEYLALTKLDLCDLSIAEIAAYIELNHKCMFFSGVPSSTEGLYFAKVGQTVDHIVQTIENRVG